MNLKYNISPFFLSCREKVSVPVFANGNIMGIEDVDHCLNETNANGVMTAEGNLHNPAIFQRNYLPLTWDLANEYLDLVEIYPCPRAYIRAHLFKIFQHLLNLKQNFDLREGIATARTIEQFRKYVNELKDMFLPCHNGESIFDDEIDRSNAEYCNYNLVLPPWICQPYVRMEPQEHIKMMSEKQKLADDPNRVKNRFFDDDGNQISRKFMKKLRRSSRNPNANGMRPKNERNFELCSQSKDCVNPLVNNNHLNMLKIEQFTTITYFFLLQGTKCDYRLCRLCCRDKCYTEIVECQGHKFCIEKIKRRKTNNVEPLL